VVWLLAGWLLAGCAAPKRTAPITPAPDPDSGTEAEAAPVEPPPIVPPTEPEPEPTETGEQEVIGLAVAELAREQIGRPYRYGGESPVYGFDCSGLVQYCYGQQGIFLPRQVRAQVQIGHSVERGQLRPGDLVFFRIDGGSVNHVGIFTGGSEFVHAPSSGKQVQQESLDDDWWRRRYVTAQRVY
jgi:cell wall-associated NlpC family hydrolase